MSPRNVLYLISPLDFLFPSPANQGSASPPGSQTQTSPGSISKVLVGVSGIFPERVDPGTCPKRGNSLCLLDTKEFPSLDRGHPLSFREGTEMMTALQGENSTPSLHVSKQGKDGKKLPWEFKYTQVTSHTDPPQDFCGWGNFHAGFLLKKAFFSFMGAGGGWQPGETRLECDKPVLLLVCVNELGLFPSSSSARFSASLQSKFTFRAQGCQHGAEVWGLVVIIINNINY